MKTEDDNDTDSKRAIKIVLWIIALVALALLNYCHFSKYISSNPERINSFIIEDNNMDKFRSPAVAGLFYPASTAVLDSEVGKYLTSLPSDGTVQPKVLIVPHAGYMYSAQTAAKAYAQLQPWKNKIHTVILVGPSHYVGFNGMALSKDDYFTTPLGKIAINKTVNSQLATKPDFQYKNEAHAKEHSIEVQLPFLQKVLKNFSIVPIVYGDAEPAQLAQALQPYLDAPDTLIVFSADLSHYYTYDEARAIDIRTKALVEKNQPEVEQHMSCGAIGINAAILLAQEGRLFPKLMDMVNSGDVSGDKSSVVGYASWLFTQQDDSKTQEPLSTLEQEVESLRAFAGRYGKELLKIAKVALDEAVRNHKKFKPARGDYDNVLFNRGASFVTLEKDDNLRGCVGSLLPSQAIAFDVAQNAYSAAMEDNRFKSVTADEVEKLKISISLLTGFEGINYKDESDLVSQLIKGVDGVIIRDGDRQGVFLPSVWKQLPEPQEFLNNLKIKAGMSPSYWSNRIKVYRFRVVEISKDEN